MYSAGGMTMSMIQARKDRRGKRAELPDDIAKKLKSCSVLSCEEWRDLSAYTTYHCFPTGEKNQERWEIWTQLLRKAREDETWIPFRGSLVCSHHFRPTDFISDPLSKRRKLMKNSIPSIFPTFTVDLEDPSYQVPEDQMGDDEVGEESYENNDDNSGTYYYEEENGSSMLTNSNSNLYEEEYDYKYASDANGSIQNGDSSYGSNVFEQYDDDDDDDDIQIIHDSESESNSNAPSSVPAGIHILSTSSLSSTTAAASQQQRMRTPPQAPSKVILVSNNATRVQNVVVHSASNAGRRKQQHQQRATVTAVKNIPFQPNRQQNSPPKLSRQEETAKAISSLPFSLNPDLEIEMIDPTEDLAASRLRISELEQQNKSLINMYESAMEGLKLKYENQILFLRKRMKEQERILEMNQIPLPKRTRMS
ncbi:DNA transposase THAP9 [Orchesella cincta]|uniref:DNA transposase THAP9 n=1 Tax=Orchesella cincta TaxID=48709 RepID=A0A1D2N988_ORCCI|nr:DNA transposase THAP9 [Orchesella cincta]